ncbi:hypothetical protein F383_24453 [Gossypium arboreum]|uniref:Uncharacterized protein n=1 Tax=Gossypium arboreum TaxID=29729 RepID=A0A0B0P038_GOSAR|nr:hypothetical protein F383_24453 [Gossypium arboreum]
MVLHWLISQVDTMSQTWSYTNYHLVAVYAMSQTWSYTGYHLVANACPRLVLHWLTSQGRCMSQTCLTLALVSMPMPYPRHDLTLALIMWPMNVPDMSYTSP